MNTHSYLVMCVIYIYIYIYNIHIYIYTYYIYRERESENRLLWGLGFCRHIFVSYLHSNNPKHTTKYRTLLFLSNVFKVKLKLRKFRRQPVAHLGIDWLRIQIFATATITGKKHRKYRVTLDFIKPRGRPHRFDTSLTEPYILCRKSFHLIRPIHPTPKLKASPALACNAWLLENMYVLNWRTKCTGLEVE